MSDGQTFTRVTPIDFAGQRWSLRFTQIGTTVFSLANGKIEMALVGGTLISVLLFGVLLSWLTLRANALQLAVRMTTELRTSEEKFRAIIDSADDIVFTLDHQQRYTGVFGHWVEKMQRTPEYFLGHTAREILGGQDQYDSDSFEANQRALAGEIAGYESVLIEGWQTRYYYTIVSPLRNESGEITGVMGLGRDVTKFKQVEDALKKTVIQREGALEALRESQIQLEAQNENLREDQEKFDSLQKRYFDLYHLAPVGYCTLNAAGLILEANLAATNLLGVTQKTILNSLLSRFVENSYLDRYYRHRKKFIETGTLQVDELQMIKRDGTIFWAQVETSFSVNDKKDGQARILISDITERKRLEKNLREYASKLEIVMEVAKIAWWEMDIQTGNVRFDKRKTEMLGYPSKNFHHYNDFMAIVHPDDYDHAMNAMREHFAGLQDKYEVKYRILTKSGEYKWFYDIGSITENDINGAPLVAMGLVMDISEREQTARLLEDTEKRLSILAEYSRAITWEVDAWGLYTYISQECLSILGYSPEEIVGKKYLPDLHPDEGRAAFKAAAFEFFERHNSFRNLENALQARDGHVIWVSTNALLILDKNGKLTGYRGVDTDISEQKRTQDALRESNALLSAFMQYSPIYIFIKAVTPTTSRVLKVSDNYQDMVGIPTAEMVGKSMEELFPLELALKMTADDWSVVRNDAVLELNEEFNGHTYSSFKFPFSVGEKTLLAGYSLDITERKRIEQALAQTAARLSLAVRAGGVGTWEYDFINDRLTWDDQMYRLYGITSAVFSGAYQAWLDGVHPQDRERGDNEIQAARRGEKEFDTEFRVVWPNGSVHDLRALALVQRDNAGKPLALIGTNWDITDQKLMLSQLQTSVAEKDALLREVQQLARTDALTGLNNLRSFNELAGHAFEVARRYHQPLALMMFDIDKFKNVNDTMGHFIGDQVLIQTAEVVSSQLRATDIFGRIGGDEFVIILPGTNAQQAFPMAERIRTEVALRTMETAKHPITVTISMGITGIAENSSDDDVETLIRQADLALYAAKAAGRNKTVIYALEMEQLAANSR